MLDILLRSNKSECIENFGQDDSKSRVALGLSKSFNALFLAALTTIGCAHTGKTEATVPENYLAHKTSERNINNPSEAETQAFLDIFNDIKLNETVDGENKPWMNNDVKKKLASAFARLAKTLKIDPKSIQNDLKLVLENIKFDIKLTNSADDVGGYASPLRIEIFPNSTRYYEEIIFHELIHSINFLYVKPEIRVGLIQTFNTYEEGATEIATKIAFPETCEFAYPSATILTAALGKDFYTDMIKKPDQFMDDLAFSPIDNKMITNGIKKHIIAFAKKWRIDRPEDLNELMAIFGFPEFGMAKTVFKKNISSTEQGPQERKQVYQLKALLERYNINWTKFLEEISPPNNNFARDWEMITGLSVSIEWRKPWKSARGCEE
ncbi:hypothetical protein IT412_04465 [Candidatus Peregrinibacteria bacterium]|nr:hypothetical protein [Candidatus Peregrinibacteria bacterium]